MLPAAIRGECHEAFDRRFGDDHEIHRLLEMRDHAVELIEEGDAGRAGTFVKKTNERGRYRHRVLNSARPIANLQRFSRSNHPTSAVLEPDLAHVGKTSKPVF